jgi:hypothetical protein
MSAIPLHLQRRFEQKWAARFSPPPAAVNAPKNVGPKATPTTPTGRRGARQMPKKSPPGRDRQLPVRGDGNDPTCGYRKVVCQAAVVRRKVPCRRRKRPAASRWYDGGAARTIVRTTRAR